MIQLHGHTCEFVVFLVGDGDREPSVVIAVLRKFGGDCCCVGGRIRQRVKASAESPPTTWKK
jgi:hypothetical protein